MNRRTRRRLSELAKIYALSALAVLLWAGLSIGISFAVKENWKLLERLGVV
jgi:hypothetical protein